MGNQSRIRGLRAVLVVGAFLLGIPVTGGWAAQSKERRDLLYGVYFLGSRIGATTVKQTPTQFKGRDATRIDSTTDIKMIALGEVSQSINLTHIIDAKGAPLFLTMKILRRAHDGDRRHLLPGSGGMHHRFAGHQVEEGRARPQGRHARRRSSGAR